MFSDKETSFDLLGFNKYVPVLGEILVSSNIAPVTMAIFGSWGSGKTSMLKMIQKYLSENYNERIETIWFNAWQYENKSEVETALIDSILSVLEKDKNLIDQAKDLWNDLVKGANFIKLAGFIGKTLLTMNPNIDDFVNSFTSVNKEITSSIRKFKSIFCELMDKWKKDKIIIFIDDLDRCLPDDVLETLETIKLFLECDKCAFVLALDEKKIDAAIKIRYKDNDKLPVVTREYLEKVVQIPFRIPVPSHLETIKYIISLCTTRYINGNITEVIKILNKTIKGPVNILAEQVNLFKNEVKEFIIEFEKFDKELNDITQYVDIICNGLKHNPRQIKRFLNVYYMRDLISKYNQLKINNAVMLKLLVIEYVWPEILNKIFESIDLETGISQYYTELLQIKIDDLDQKIDKIKEFDITLNCYEFLRQAPSLNKVDLRDYAFTLNASNNSISLPYFENVVDYKLQLVEVFTNGQKYACETYGKQLNGLSEIQLKELVNIAIEYALKKNKQDWECSIYFLKGLSSKYNTMVVSLLSESIVKRNITFEDPVALAIYFTLLRNKSDDEKLELVRKQAVEKLKDSVSAKTRELMR